jgi:hypothetical protein
MEEDFIGRQGSRRSVVLEMEEEKKKKEDENEEEDDTKKSLSLPAGLQATIIFSDGFRGFPHIYWGKCHYSKHTTHVSFQIPTYSLNMFAFPSDYTALSPAFE